MLDCTLFNFACQPSLIRSMSKAPYQSEVIEFKIRIDGGYEQAAAVFGIIYKMFFDAELSILTQRFQCTCAYEQAS